MHGLRGRGAAIGAFGGSWGVPQGSRAHRGPYEPFPQLTAGKYKPNQRAPRTLLGPQPRGHPRKEAPHSESFLTGPGMLLLTRHKSP